MTMKTHVFAINVSGRNLSAENAQRLLDQLINVGLADATSTLEDKDCSNPDTQLALDSNFSSPKPISELPSIQLLDECDSYLREIRAETLDGSEPALGALLDKTTAFWAKLQAGATPAPSMAEQLAQLKAAGLTFADCKLAFAAPNDNPFVVKAREMLLGDDCVVDDHTVSSDSDTGAFVMCWVHVRNAEAGILPIPELLENVYEKATDWLAANARTLPLEEQSLLGSQTDWLEDLIGNFADELDEVAFTVPKGAPGPIVWVGMDNQSCTFLPSDALKRLIDLARQGGLDPLQVKSAEDFNSKFGQKLDAILTVIQTA